jgi:hypothetical protein
VTVLITVDPVNDAPRASSASKSVAEDGSLPVDLAALVSDVETGDGDLAYTIVSVPAHGGLTGSDGAPTYTPDRNFNGVDSFTYKVTDRGDPDGCSSAACDAAESSSTETVSIAVDPVNDAPQANSTSKRVAEDGALPVDLAALVSDVETTDADLTYTIVSGPAHGGLTGSDGAPTYTPNPDFNGLDSFTYKVTDRGDPDGCPGAQCDAARSSSTEMVVITVDPVNDAPSAATLNDSVGEDGSLPVDLAGLASDVETSDGNLTYTIESAPSHGRLTGGGAARTYTPEANYNGPDSFTYKVTDRGDPDGCAAAPCDTPKSSSTQTVSLTVDPVNDAPQVAPASATVDEDGSVPIDLGALATDLETSAADLTYIIVAPPAHGNLPGLGGSRTYSPDPDYNGPDSFTYEVTDRGDPDNCAGPACDAAKTSSIETVSLTVGAVNDAPVNDLPAGPLTAVQDTDTAVGGLSVTDIDAGADNVALEISVGHGTLTVADDVLGGAGPLQITGNGTRDVTVTATLAQLITTLAASDGLVYRGDAGYTGADTLTVRSDDLGHTGAGGAKTDTDTLALVVKPPNDPAVPADRSVTTSEDTAKTITLSASDSDGPSDARFAIADAPAHGTLGALGAVSCSHATPNVCTTDVTYTPDSDFNGPDGFSYTADDGFGVSAPATVSITVTPVNDAPKLQGIEGGALAYTENDPATPITATTTVTDVDSPNFDTGTLSVDFSAGGRPEDRLVVVDQGGGPGQIGVSGSTVSFGGTPMGTFTGGTGTTPLVVIFNAGATLAAAQALVRDVGYRNVSESPSTPSRAAHFFLTDGDGGTSAAVSRDITVAAVNDAPVVTTTGGALSHVEGDGPEAIDPGVTVADVDSPDLAGATVQLTGNYASGQDVLAAVAPLFGVTASYDASTGTLTLSGATTLANYQAILRAVTYENTSQAPSIATRTVTYKADDGAAQSAAATKDIAVTGVDDAPTLTTSAGSTPYTEQAAAAAVDDALALSDPDGGANPTGATVEVLSPLAGDTLSVAGQNGITGTFAAGVLTLSGSATLAQYQAALRSVQFGNATNDAPGSGRSIRFGLTTPVASNTSTKSLAITQVNDPPAVDPTDAAGSALEQTATAIDTGIVLSDPDSASLKGATVRISGNFQSGEDTLQFATQNGITGNVSGDTLTLTGSATVAQYQTALRSVTYTDTSDTPNTSVRTITFRATDDETPGVQSAAQTRDLNVVPVNDAPSDAGESQNATGNTRLEVALTSGGSSLPKRTAATGNLLDNANDVDDAHSALSVDTSTVSAPQHGSVSVNADGSYVYTPAASYTGADSFTYKVKDDENAQSAASTVSITVANRVWYVKNDAAAGGDGRSQTPFTTLDAADTNATATGDTIYVLRGTGATGLTDTVDLLANQRLLGEAADLVVAGTTLFTGTPANRPPLSGTVNLDDANTIRGVAIASLSPTPPAIGAPAIVGATGDVAGTITDVTLSGAAGGLDLNATTGTWDLTDLTANTTGGTAVNLNNAGTVNFTPAGTISLSSAAGPALTASTNTTPASTALSGTIDSVTTTSSPTTGISVTNTTGSLTLDDINLAATGTALTLNNANNVTVNNSGDADISAAGRAINHANGPTTQPNAPDVTLDQVTSSGGTEGINIDGIGEGTFSAVGGTLSGHSAAELDINGGSGNITYPGTIGNGSGLSVQITGRSTGTVALAGNINDTSDAGGGIDMSGNSGGTFNFSGTTKTLNTGAGAAFSSTGSGPTINLTGGGLDIDTTGGAGLTATGGGTLSIPTGASPNTIDTTTGTALNVTSTNIANTGLTFRSISAGTTTAGPTNGIVLSGTGAAGRLLVTGTGSSALGGDASGGTIQRATNYGVSLTSTLSPSLTNVVIKDIARNGIDGTDVTNFTLANSQVSNTGTAAAGQYEENSIAFVDRTTPITDNTIDGTVTLTQNVISQPRRNAIMIETWNGTIDALNISNNTLSGGTTTSSILDAIHVFAQGSAAATSHITTATIQNNNISDFRFFDTASSKFIGGNGIRIAGGSGNGTNNTVTTLGAAATPIVISGNDVDNVGSNFIAVSFNGEQGLSNFQIDNNGTIADPMSHAEGLGVSVFFGGTGTFGARVNNNMINGIGETVNAGSSGIAFQNDTGPSGSTTANPQSKFSVTNNDITNTDGNGLFGVTLNNSGFMNMKIQSNTVHTVPRLAARYGIRVAQNNATSSGICMNLQSNTTAGGAGITGKGIGIRRASPLTFGITGMAATASPGVEAYIDSQNPSGAGSELISASTGFSNCTLPAAMP